LILPGPFASASTRTTRRSFIFYRGRQWAFLLFIQQQKENTMSAKKARSREEGASKQNGANGDDSIVFTNGDGGVSADTLEDAITYSLSDEEIARKAYALWEERGRPIGSAEEDWFKAKEQLNM
jgi:hypothetical protein